MPVGVMNTITPEFDRSQVAQCRDGPIKDRTRGFLVLLPTKIA